MNKKNYNPTDMGYSAVVNDGSKAPDKITFIKTKEMEINGLFNTSLADIIHPKTTGSTVSKRNKKALKRETVLVILKDQKKSKLNKELRKQVFNNYCGIYTNVIVLKDTDIKIGGDLNVLRGMSFDSIILKCFLTTPVYEYLREVLAIKMMLSIDKDIRSLPELQLDSLELGL